MSDMFELAKSISEVYAEGLKQRGNINHHKNDPDPVMVVINHKAYKINLKTKTVWQYYFYKGGDEAGDFEGWEPVGSVVTV